MQREAVSWWEVIDVSSWPALQGEPRGLRAKQWVADSSGQPWLRKAIRGWEKVPGGSRPTEPAVEAFTLELARRCGFDVAHGRAAIWSTAKGQVRGFVSRKFGDAGDEQRTGSELVPGFERDSLESRTRATLQGAYHALGLAMSALDDELREPFVRMLLFDAWIGNGDRHLGNWALLVGFGRTRFAPMFDTAGCLGTELLEDHPLFGEGVTDGQVEAYAHRCKSGFGDGESRPGIQQDEVIAAARRWPEWRPAYEALYPQFCTAMREDVGALLDQIPDDWWSERRRRFALRLLGVRVKILEGAVP